MSRLSHQLKACQERGEKALGLFLTNGFPEPKATLPLLHAMADGGADFIELGMPFSDPLAEGIPIQRASARALAQGIKMADTFRTAEAFRRERETPLLLMGYINPVLQYGVSNFCRTARSCGVDGLILPDVPLEEMALVQDAVRENDLDLIALVAPTTPAARVAELDETARGFLYAVSVTGLTGAALEIETKVEPYLRRLRSQVTQNPLLVGFGIKTHADAQRLCRHTDGFIVGSALINAVETAWADPQKSSADRLKTIRDFSATLKYGSSSAYA